MEAYKDIPDIPDIPNIIHPETGLTDKSVIPETWITAIWTAIDVDGHHNSNIRWSPIASDKHEDTIEVCIRNSFGYVVEFEQWSNPERYRHMIKEFSEAVLFSIAECDLYLPPKMTPIYLRRLWTSSVFAKCGDTPKDNIWSHREFMNLYPQLLNQNIANDSIYAIHEFSMPLGERRVS